MKGLFPSLAVILTQDQPGRGHHSGFLLGGLRPARSRNTQVAEIREDGRSEAQAVPQSLLDSSGPIGRLRTNLY